MYRLDVPHDIRDVNARVTDDTPSLLLADSRAVAVIVTAC
jgi:hypothetical protein